MELVRCLWSLIELLWTNKSVEILGQKYQMLKLQFLVLAGLSKKCTRVNSSTSISSKHLEMAGMPLLSEFGENCARCAFMEQQKSPLWHGCAPLCCLQDNARHCKDFHGLSTPAPVTGSAHEPFLAKVWTAYKDIHVQSVLVVVIPNMVACPL